MSNFISDFILASFSSSLGKTAVAPLERVKLLLQLQDANNQIKPEEKFKGITDCIIRVTKEQGFFTLWRGNLANVLRYFPMQAANFAIWDELKTYFPKHNPETDFPRFFFWNLAAGGVAGGISSFIGQPLDFVRTRLSVDIGKAVQDREFTGILDCIEKIWVKEKIKGFYRGISVTIPAMALYRASYFGIYESLQMKLPEEQRNGVITKFFIAIFSTYVGGFLIYPTDTIKRRMMMQANRKDVLYEGVADCCKKIYSEGGVSAFYKGMMTNMLRSIGSALILVFYDKAQSYWKGK